MKTRTIRYALLSTAAAAAIALPLLAGASIPNSAHSLTRSALDSVNLNDARDQQELYERLKIESRKVCGSTNIHVTGSVERAAGNEECYEETLAVAIERVGSPALKELHDQ